MPNLSEESAEITAVNITASNCTITWSDSHINIPQYTYQPIGTENSISPIVTDDLYTVDYVSSPIESLANRAYKKYISSDWKVPEGRAPTLEDNRQGVHELSIGLPLRHYINRKLSSVNSHLKDSKRKITISPKIFLKTLDSDLSKAEIKKISELRKDLIKEIVKLQVESRIAIFDKIELKE